MAHVVEQQKILFLLKSFIFTIYQFIRLPQRIVNNIKNTSPNKIGRKSTNTPATSQRKFEDILRKRLVHNCNLTAPISCVVIIPSKERVGEAPESYSDKYDRCLDPFAHDRPFRLPSLLSSIILTESRTFRLSSSVSVS